MHQSHDKFSVFQPKSFLSKTIFLDLQKQKKKEWKSIREREGGKIDQGTRFAEKFCHFVESDRFLERTFHWLSPSLKPKRAFSTVDWIAQKKQIENLLLTFLLFYSSIRFMYNIISNGVMNQRLLLYVENDKNVKSLFTKICFCFQISKSSSLTISLSNIALFRNERFMLDEMT